MKDILIWNNGRYLNTAYLHDKTIECNVLHIGKDNKLNIICYSIRQNGLEIKRDTIENIDDNKAIELAKIECQKFVNTL